MEEESKFYAYAPYPGMHEPWTKEELDELDRVLRELFGSDSD